MSDPSFMSDPSLVRMVCGVLAIALLGLIVMRRRGRASAD